jgi:hypothetical protein
MPPDFPEEPNPFEGEPYFSADLTPDPPKSTFWHRTISGGLALAWLGIAGWKLPWPLLIAPALKVLVLMAVIWFPESALLIFTWLFGWVRHLPIFWASFHRQEEPPWLVRGAAWLAFLSYIGCTAYLILR